MSEPPGPSTLGLLDLAALALNFANIVVFGLIASYSFRRYYKTKRPRYIALGFIGFYWCALYVYVTLAAIGAVPAFVDSVTFGRTFVRPAFTLTGSFMLWSMVHPELEAIIQHLVRALRDTDDDRAPK